MFFKKKKGKRPQDIEVFTVEDVRKSVVAISHVWSLRDMSC